MHSQSLSTAAAYFLNAMASNNTGQSLGNASHAQLGNYPMNYTTALASLVASGLYSLPSSLASEVTKVVSGSSQQHPTSVNRFSPNHSAEHAAQTLTTATSQHHQLQQHLQHLAGLSKGLHLGGARHVSGTSRTDTHVCGSVCVIREGVENLVCLSAADGAIDI